MGDVGCAEMGGMNPAFNKVMETRENIIGSIISFNQGGLKDKGRDLKRRIFVDEHCTLRKL